MSHDRLQVILCHDGRDRFSNVYLISVREGSDDRHHITFLGDVNISRQGSGQLRDAHLPHVAHHASEIEVRWRQATGYL